MFERAHELVVAENEQKRLADEKLSAKMKTLSQALDPNVLQEIQVVNEWDPFDPAAILKRSEPAFQSLKSKVDAFSRDRQKAMDERKVTFKMVCKKALDLLSADGDSLVLQIALERLVCYDVGQKIRVPFHFKDRVTDRIRTRKCKVNHNAELKRALAETKRTRPELWIMLPKLLEHKEKMRAAMGEKPVESKPNDSKSDEEDDEN